MHTLRASIAMVINFFYEMLIAPTPSLSKIISPELFRYAACGGGNMVFDWCLYFLIYNYGLEHQMVDLGIITLSSHIATKFIVFPITLFTGFWLNRNVTFTQSSLRGDKQLVRYMEIIGVNILINYVGLKFFVDVCKVYPTPSNIIVSLITVAISYFGQKYYSFKK